MESGRPLSPSEPRDGRGGWRTALFIIVVGLFERIGFTGVEGNLITYLSGPLGMSTAAAATGANAWSGTVLVLPLVGALAADSRIGRYRAVLLAGVLYLLSLGMLTVSSLLQTRRPRLSNCHNTSAVCSPSPSKPSPAGLAFFYVALYLLALAQGFNKPCSEALGADQFGHGDPASSRSSYFNWFHFSISWGYATAATAVTYVQENVGWTVGFAACWATMVVYLAVFLLGTGTYRAEQPVDGSLLARLTEKFTVSREVVSADTDTQRLSTGGPEEEGKGFLVKLLPIWLSSLVFAAAIAQITTLFTKQGSTMERRIGGLVVPPAALQCFISITYITLLPVYDRALVPLARRLTGHPAGITMLQRVGAGMAMCSVAMAVAALVEARRLRAAEDAGLLDRPDVAVPMSLWWLVPQYVLLGLAEVLSCIGLEEFFYDQVPDELRSVGLALCLSIFGAGSYASGALVASIDWATTRGGGESWFSDNLNRAHLDYFYWLLAGLGALEVAVFLYFAMRYMYRNKPER